MRTTQYIGLTKKCQEQTQGLEKREIPGWQTFGMFDEDIPLYAYYRKDGSMAAIEYVHACPWSSGPMIFLGLMTSNGPSPYNWLEDIKASDSQLDYDEGIYYV